MSSKFIIIVVALFFSPLLFCQGTFLEKGISGFWIGSGYGARENISNIGGNLGYSFNGMIDLGVALNREVVENRVLGDDLNSVSISPFISFVEHYHQILMSVNLSYRHDFVSSDAFDSLEVEARGDYYSVGAAIFNRFWMTESFFIQPFINGNYIAGREKAVNPSPGDSQPSLDEFYLSRLTIHNGPIYQEVPPGQTRSEFVQKLIWGFGFDLCFEAVPAIVLNLTPNIRFDDGEAIFGIRSGLVFKTENRRGESFNKSYSIQKPDQFVRLVIASVLKKHFLLYQTERTPMEEGDSFDVVRQDESSSEWTKIGKASVVRVKGSKVVFEYYLDNKFDRLTSDDRIFYRY